MRFTARSMSVALSAVLLAGGVAGCSSSGADSTPETSAPGTVTVAKDDALAAMVPAEIAADGILTIGTDASYAPSEFIGEDGQTIEGFDIDLAKAVGQVLGLEVQMQNAPFDSLVEGVKTGKYELGVSSFTINPERAQQVDMVSYFSAGTSWAAPAGNPAGISPDAACGMRIAVQKATVQVPDITARSEACEAAGSEGITIQQYQLQSDATAAVVSGKDDAMLADSPVVAYAVAKTGGKLEIIGNMYDSAPYGYAVPKGQPDYTAAIQGALQKLMDDGAYLEILKSWGVEGGALTTSEVTSGS